MIYLEYFNPQFVYEIVFWIITFFLLKKFWGKEKVRLAYGYITAGLNLLAVGLFAYISMNGNFKFLDAIAFSFLHTIVAFVMFSLVIISKKLEKENEENL